MKYEINNFLDNSHVEVLVVQRTDWVCIKQYAGSLNFQHTMTPTQAREMAAALIACADVQDALVNADFAAHREMIGVEA